MRKFLVVGSIVGMLAGQSMAACMGPFCWDDKGAYINGNILNGNGAALPSKTSTQINAITPDGAGQRVYCSNCTRSYVCVSSGTGTGAFTVEVETGTMAANPTHCS